ncbi:tetratricopeptide repeat protein [Streptomyces beijiangensis]|uniref:Tetratricopeptide repeat protein n=1 Tax=Streptomyces beijiangensis TaxID=163361 RepID=A0A939JG11_9ACTN|nr:tetratricopeptide repeat protein [Streptomyces beijiangensis]MBO0512958.1 tetratricopeptide repeat protein [Streptomyces beijiangensis]
MLRGIALRRAGRVLAEGEELLAGGDSYGAGLRFDEALGRAGKHLTSGEPEVAGVAAGARVGLGRVCLVGSDFEQALGQFQEAQRLLPGGVDGYYWAGCAAAHLQRLADAERYFDAALERGPGDPRALAQRARVYFVQGRQPLARADLQAAEGVGQPTADDRWLLSVLQVRGADWAGAEKSLRGLVHEDTSRTPVALALLAYALERSGRQAAALPMYEQALVEGFETDSVLYRQGLVAYGLGRYDVSVRAWSALCERRPGDAACADALARATYAAAVPLVRRKDFAAAAEQLGRSEPHWPAGALDDTIADLRLYAAWKDADRGGPRAVRGHLEEALLRRPGDVRAVRSMALVEFWAGKRERAATLWTRALELRPEDIRARLELGLCYEKLGRKSDAERELTYVGQGAEGALRERAGLALAALSLADGAWGRAADLLMELPDESPRDVLLTEALYRSGRDRERSLGPLWRAAADARAGDGASARRALERADPATAGRAAREVALLVRKAALEEGAESGSLVAAVELSDRHLGESGGRFAASHAVLRINAGRRDAAVTTLRAAARRDPTDHRTLHTLALALLHGLGEGKGEGAGLKEQCIASWAALLHSPAFWEDFRIKAGGRYGEPVPTARIDSVKGKLKEYAEARLAAAGGGPSSRVLLERELRAARLLAESGGFPPAPGSARTLACGPLFLAEWGLVDTFGDFLRAAEEMHAGRAAAGRRGSGGRTYDAGQLRRSFSVLGIAEAQAEAGLYADALETLADHRCVDCRTQEYIRRQGVHTRQVRSRSPQQCRSGCPSFDTVHPGYAGRAGKERLLAEDADALAAQILLKRSRATLSEAEPDLEEVSASWREAVDRSSAGGQAGQVHTEIADMAIGRAESLLRAKRRDEAVAVLECARSTTAGGQLDRVQGQLAGALNARGVQTVNALHEARETMADGTMIERLRPPVADLRRSVELNPHAAVSHLNLCHVLNVLASLLIKDGSVIEAVDLLQERADKMAVARGHHPGNPEIETMNTQAADDMTAVLVAIANSRSTQGRR